MTYWPISSPSVFAATKCTSSGRTHVSHDGVEHEQSSAEHVQTNAREETFTQKNGVVKYGAEPQESQRSTSPIASEEDIHGNIVTVRVTRNGHLFATLTRTTLTVWQTKACSLRVLP